MYTFLEAVKDLCFILILEIAFLSPDCAIYFLTRRVFRFLHESMCKDEQTGSIHEKRGSESSFRYLSNIIFPGYQMTHIGIYGLPIDCHPFKPLQQSVSLLFHT